MAFRLESGTYSLNLSGIDFDDADASGNELLSQTVRKATHSSLGGTVNRTTRVGLATCGFTSTKFSTLWTVLPTGNRANVNNVTGATVGPRLENGQDGLGDVDKTSDVGCEHDIDVFLGNFRGFRDALDETSACQHQSYSMTATARTMGKAIRISWVGTYALFTRMLMSLKSSGRLGTSWRTSSGLLTSNLTG